jgi:hypothetical protein
VEFQNKKSAVYLAKNIGFNYEYVHARGGHAVAQLVEALHYKVVSSIPDGVSGIFH